MIGSRERTSQIPEYNGLNTASNAPFDYDVRTRGLGKEIEKSYFGLSFNTEIHTGATSARPASSAAEENLLCRPYSPHPTAGAFVVPTGDWYYGESIAVHEFAHSILTTW